MLFFLPGYTLVNMLFPRRGELDPEYDQVYRVALGMGLSMVLAILVGFALNAVSTEEHGYVRAGSLWAVLGLMTLVFAVLGWLRGAYPWAGMIHPGLYRAPGLAAQKGTALSGFARKRQLDRLLLERERLLRDIKAFSEASTTSNPTRRLYYRKRMDSAKERLSQIDEELRALGERVR